MIDVRLLNGFFVFPYTFPYTNAVALTTRTPSKIAVEFIITAQDIGYGLADIHFPIRLKLDDGNAAEIRIIGTILLENVIYFE